MTREDIIADYKTDDKEEFILSPGKFEGEPVWVPYFWDWYLNGCADNDEDGILFFDVTDEDREEFPTLFDVKEVRLWETAQGFVCSEAILID